MRGLGLLAAGAALTALLAGCAAGRGGGPPATTSSTVAAATTVATTTTSTLAWDSAEAIQRVADYCGVAAGDLSPVTSTPDGAAYASNAFSGQVGTAIVTADGRIGCQGLR